jgi:hypothetical protein
VRLARDQCGFAVIQLGFGPVDAAIALGEALGVLTKQSLAVVEALLAPLGVAGPFLGDRGQRLDLPLGGPAGSRPDLLGIVVGLAMRTFEDAVGLLTGRVENPSSPAALASAFAAAASVRAATTASLTSPPARSGLVGAVADRPTGVSRRESFPPSNWRSMRVMRRNPPATTTPKISTAIASTVSSGTAAPSRRASRLRDATRTRESSGHLGDGCYPRRSRGPVRVETGVAHVRDARFIARRRRVPVLPLPGTASL